MKQSAFGTLFLAIALACLGACSDKQEPAPAPASTVAEVPAAAATLQQASLPAPQLLKSSDARFSAKLPCPDCAGIELGISLQRDEHGGNSFVLRYQRMQPDAAPAVISGNWILQAGKIDNRDAAVIILNPRNPARRARLRINDDSSMTLIDGSLNGVTAGTRPVFRFDSGDLDLRALYEKKLAAGESTH
ncbi:MAG: copper resistance protein NlpE N-terminal domain-containing protein [Rhodanobacteraceae bacterium]